MLIRFNNNKKETSIAHHLHEQPDINLKPGLAALVLMALAVSAPALLQTQFGSGKLRSLFAGIGF